MTASLVYLETKVTVEVPARRVDLAQRERRGQVVWMDCLVSLGSVAYQAVLDPRENREMMDPLDCLACLAYLVKKDCPVCLVTEV